MTHGVLLINLGTPCDPSPAAVRHYLQTFLSDPRVVDIPRLLRLILVYGVIGPFRARHSAKAYQSIWTEAGSPLLVHSKALAQALSQTLGSAFKVVLGMRYGEPSLQQAITDLAKHPVDRLTILPLFPQYASASTGSALEATLKILARQTSIPHIRVIRDFYDLPAYIEAYATVIQNSIQGQALDQILFSYHGLPERQIRKTRCAAGCIQSPGSASSPCKAIDDSNRDCYRAQCYETTRLLAEKLGLKPDHYQIGFQSRLGRTPWIKPYTDEVLVDLRRQGFKDIAVVCPSFVSDCLETLEEITIRAREQWTALGGHTLISIPCLNHHPQWVEGLAAWIRKLE